MTDIIYQGGLKALTDGDLVTGCDLRVMLVAENFSGVSGEDDAINIADFATLDEFSGVGYQEVDCENVTVAYDSGSGEYRVDFDDAEWNADGLTVAPGPRDAIGILVKLHVDGTESNDIAIGYSDSGGFPINGIGSQIELNVPAGGLMFIRGA